MVRCYLREVQLGALLRHGGRQAPVHWGPCPALLEACPLPGGLRQEPVPGHPRVCLWGVLLDRPLARVRAALFKEALHRGGSLGAHPKVGCPSWGLHQVACPKVGLAHLREGHCHKAALLGACGGRGGCPPLLWGGSSLGRLLKVGNKVEIFIQVAVCYRELSLWKLLAHACSSFASGW